MEVWKDCIEYPDLYQISSLGRVFSKRTDKVVKQSLSKAGGYPTLSTRIAGREGVARCFKVHRLVAECFVDNKKNKPFVNHIDGNKLNNTPDNLEWVTSLENMQHAVVNGLHRVESGFDHYNAKLTQENIQYILDNYKPYCRINGTRAIAKRLGIDHTQVSRVFRRVSYK